MRLKETKTYHYVSVGSHMTSHESEAIRFLDYLEPLPWELEETELPECEVCFEDGVRTRLHRGACWKHGSRLWEL